MDASVERYDSRMNARLQNDPASLIAAGRRALLLVTALAHAGLTLAAWVLRPGPSRGGALALDDIGLLFLTITRAIFLAVAVESSRFS